MTHYVVPNTVLALPGFAAGIDWSDTLLLLGIAACMFVALGAFAMIMLARQLPFLNTTRQAAVAPPPPLRRLRVPCRSHRLCRPTASLPRSAARSSRVA